MCSIDIISPIIYFDELKNLYNFPYVLKFKSSEEIIDFYFHEEDFKTQEEMLENRNEYISNSIVNSLITEQFQRLQEICLIDEQNIDQDVLANEISERLNIIYHLSLVLFKLNTSTYEQPLNIIYEELIELFILLEDFFIGIRKPELKTLKSKLEEIKLILIKKK